MKDYFLSEPLLFLKGALVFAIGPLNHQLAYLTLAMVIDLVFGIRVALKENNFKLTTLVKKFGVKVSNYLLWIAMFHALDMVAGLPDTARWALILTLVGMEIFSATKNTSKLGHSSLANTMEALYLTLMRQKGGTSSAEETPTKPKPVKGKKKSAKAPDNDSSSI